MIQLFNESGSRRIASIQPPDMGTQQLSIRRDGEPLISIEYTAGGELTIGHWPLGQEWVRLVTYRANRP